jgi:RNA polymerase sigma factor (sigma-70 family)
MKDPLTISDQDFLLGIRNCDPVIEKAFYEENYGMVRGMIYRYDSSRSVAVDDHYQDVMAIIFTRIKDGKLTQLTAKLSTFVYSIARNLLLDKLRRSRKMINAPIEDDHLASDDSELVNLDALEIAAMEMIKNLKPPCNEIIIDWYLHQLNYEQIAEKHKYKNANTAKKKKGDCIAGARITAKNLLANQHIA